MDLTIRNIPPDVHRQLVRSAELQGRNLNAQLVYILTRETTQKARRRMRASRKQLERFVLSLPKMPPSAKLIREDRGR